MLGLDPTKLETSFRIGSSPETTTDEKSPKVRQRIIDQDFYRSYMTLRSIRR
jgi:hypothetical protein